MSAPAASRPEPPTEERKQVTVLFVDVARSMELAERLEPDDWSATVGRLFGLCRTAVERFGGTVDKFTGDGIMALFGAPVAQEDHAQRACHAGLAAVAAAAAFAEELRADGIDLAVRVGMNSGEVVAGPVEGAAYTAVGHTVGLAQRMESLAEPGSAFLSEHTARLVTGDFRLRPLGPVAVKGSTVPLGVFALESAVGGQSAPGRRGRTGTARLVGRDAELRALTDALAAAAAGEGSVLGVVGEAGSGKSRLCEELVARAREKDVAVRRTSGVSHATSAPLLPVLALLQDYFDVVDSDAPGAIREKVAERLLDLDEAFDADLPLVFDFMEVPDPDRPAPRLGSDARRRQVLDVFRRLTQRRSQGQALLLVAEDLHWFDPYSVAFLEAWLPSIAGTRTLLLTNFRPEFHPPWAGSSRYRQVPLGPLREAAVGELLGDLLGLDPALTALTGQLLGRTGGNPFFAEEIVRSLAADGTLEGTPGRYRLARPAEGVRVPATVQAVLAGRIDRLAPAEKAALQAAAVVGRTFTRTVLRTVLDWPEEQLDDALAALCSAELLQETGIGDERRFWHPLTQEVAYGSLVTRTRRALHRAAAGALQATSPERLDELAALVAGHYELAHENVEAARWQLRAARGALRTDPAEAARRWRVVLRLLADAADSPDAAGLGLLARTLLLRMGARTGMSPEEAATLFAEARPVAERLGDPALSTALLIADGAMRFIAGDGPGTLTSFRQAHAESDRSADHALRAWARSAGLVIWTYTGPIGESLALADASLVLRQGDPRAGEAIAGYSAHDQALALRLYPLVQGGRLAEARRHFAVAQAAMDARPVAELRSWMLSAWARLAEATGEPDDVAAARPATAEALRLARDSANVLAWGQALYAASVVALLDGKAEAAAAAAEEGVALVRRHRILADESSLLAQLSRARLTVGDPDAARGAAEEALSVARQRAQPIPECLAQLALAQARRAGAHDLAGAAEAVAAGLELSASLGAVTHGAFLAEEAARLGGDPTALAAVADAYAQMGATGHAHRLRAELAAASGA